MIPNEFCVKSPNIMKLKKFNSNEKKKLKELGINTVYLFGSRAQNLENEKSDFDVALLLKDDSRIYRDKEQAYLEIYELFADHFQTKRNIDIIFLHGATGQLRYHVVKEGMVLYDEEPAIRNKFEEYVIIEHADFEYFRKSFEEAILKRAA